MHYSEVHLLSIILHTSAVQMSSSSLVQCKCILYLFKSSLVQYKCILYLFKSATDRYSAVKMYSANAWECASYSAVISSIEYTVH